MNNHENDFDIIKSELEKMDKNITLPDSLKSENLLDLIKDVEPIAAPPKKEKNVFLFNKKGFAIAAALVLAIGFTIIYKSISSIKMGNSMMEESAISEDAKQSQNSVADEAYDEEMTEAAPEMAKAAPPEAQASGSEENESFLSDEPMEDFSTNSIAPNSAMMQTMDKNNWRIENNTILQSEETIYAFPFDFTLTNSYHIEDILILDGVKNETGEPVVSIFNYESGNKLTHKETIISKGETIYTLVYSGSTVIISGIDNQTYINCYQGGSSVQESVLEFPVSIDNIYEGNDGFALTDGSSTAYIFDKSASLLRTAEIEAGLTFENIIVEKAVAYLFLSDGETLNVPLQ